MVVAKGIITKQNDNKRNEYCLISSAVDGFSIKFVFVNCITFIKIRESFFIVF